jgi:hypothetical protein
MSVTAVRTPLDDNARDELGELKRSATKANLRSALRHENEGVVAIAPVSFALRFSTVALLALLNGRAPWNRVGVWYDEPMIPLELPKETSVTKDGDYWLAIVAGDRIDRFQSEDDAWVY